MLARKTFSKLGKREMARLPTGLSATLVRPEGAVRCVLENISRKGCRLMIDEPPKVGATVAVRVDRIDALGTIIWVRGKRCGVGFATPVAVEALERVRWSVEHEVDHERAKMSKAAAVWR